MNASELMARCLENESVEYVFGLPGEENIDLLEALYGSKIKFITTRHEQGAAFMADVYGRIKHKPGVCLATLGPGALNLTTGVASANLDHSPLVAITGQGSSQEHHLEQHQYIDVVRAFHPITKWNAKISTANMIPELVHKAFAIASVEKQGATHLELPEDIAKKETTGAPLPKREIPKTIAVDEAIEEAAEAINNSKYPIILAGNGVLRTQSAHALLEFVEKTGIPVAKTFMAKGAISSKHPFSIGNIGLQARDYIICEFDRADCVITIGYDRVEYSPKFWNSRKDKTIIDIDTRASRSIDEYYSVKGELVGDLAINMKRLAQKISKRAEWTAKTKEKIASVKKDYTPGFPIKPQHILSALRSAMKDEDILVSDVGMHKLWISRLFETYVPNTTIISNGLASMGIALPGAMGAKLAKPESNVVSISGDGGFMMNMQELETAKRHNIPGVHIVWTDQHYGMIKWKQERGHKNVFGVNFSNPDFLGIAKAFGIDGYRVEKHTELEDVLKTALASGKLCLVEIPVDYSENAKMVSSNMVCEM